MVGQHRFAALLALGALLVWAVVLGLVLLFGALDDESSGRIAAVFPRGRAQEDMLAAVAAADGLAVSGTWFDNVLVVQGESAGLVRRLKAGGVVAAYHTYGVDYLMLGGCFFAVTPRA